MKQYFIKRFVIAGFVLLSIPATLLAQKEDKNKNDKKDFEQIIITRTGDANEKTVIEIKGDKITVNGKEIKEGDKVGDVTVYRNTLKGARALTAFDQNGIRVGDVNFNNGGWTMQADHLSLFDEDSNRAMLGVNTESTSEDKIKGSKITSVVKESAAEKAGLQKGDIITKINDKQIDGENSITSIIKKNKPGDKITVTYVRDGKEQKITTELGKWQGVRMNSVTSPNFFSREMLKDVHPSIVDTAPLDFKGSYAYGFGGAPKLGLSVQDTEDGKGVNVLEVSEESNAAKAGLKKDDIITHVNGQEVNSADEAAKAIRENKDKASFTVKVKRNGKMQDIEVRVPKKLQTKSL